ncbi:MAG: MFS transporter [Proteobacteria bacterium]|nr:MFS transporter [Pseudomonadota bacterium]
MQVPTRISYGGRSGAPLALIAATAAVTMMFAATPFLVPAIAARYNVSEGTVGAISIAQVGAFAAANFVLPRLFRPSGRTLRLAAFALMLLNAASIAPSWFPVLVVLRILAGAAAGTMTWLTWTNAMKRKSSMSAVASTGPLVVLIAAPIVAMAATQGDRVVYAILAVVTIPAALLFAPVTGRRRAKGVISGSRSNRLLLGALGALTFFGSALFINQAVVARDIHDLSPLATSLAFSLNAAGGLLGARLSVKHVYPGWFMLTIGPAALLTVLGPPFGFYIGMAWWGFAFWMSVPGILRMLVDRSLEPSERAGDGQGLMALGRAFGPAMGGYFVDAGGLTTLAIISGIGISTSGLTVVGVKQGREMLPPTDPRTIDQRET